jgi:putative intracellular protease/amidase
MSAPSPTPQKIALILYPGFQLLDATGPLDAFSLLAHDHALELVILADTLSPVTTQTFAHDTRGSSFSSAIVPTHTFADAPADIDMLLVPGGYGNRNNASTLPVVEFLKTLDLSGKGRVKWVLTVCTGSEVLARTGVLGGRRATTNKRAYNEVTSFSLPCSSYHDIGLTVTRSKRTIQASTGSPKHAGSSTSTSGPAAGFLQAWI